MGVEMASSTNLDRDVKQKMIEQARALAEKDPQLSAAFPNQDIADGKLQPGLSLVEVMQLIMEGYADRAALGQRATEIQIDEATQRQRIALLPEFEPVSYGELWRQARALAAYFHHFGDPSLAVGDVLCALGFTSPDYAKMIMACLQLGIVYVPLQTSASATTQIDIMAETQARVLAVSIDYLDNAIEVISGGCAPDLIVVMEYDERDDDQRERLARAVEFLASASSRTVINTLGAIVEQGSELPDAPLFIPGPDEDPLGALFYTSGTTGTPKGAIFPQSLLKTTWLANFPTPTITLSFMPMAHLVGHGYMILTLANGGTSYCCPRADLSSLFEDFSLARPTMASIVPRVCELFYHRYLSDYDRAVAQGGDPETIAAALKKTMREQMLGGRLVSVGCGSASLAPATYAFMESMLEMHMSIGYSSTEIAGGTILVDWRIQRPPVIDYKLEDVPELGYFSTDRPHPRGELLVKSAIFVPGYFKQPELTAEKFDDDGFYRTGDVMAELGPDHLVYLDRRNNVQKLSQGEFVAIARLEALYSHAQDIGQIYIYGTSERSYLLAVIVPSADLLDSAGAQEADEQRLKATLRAALQGVAEAENLNGYEVPRDFIVEREPFSLKNTLLTEVGKHQRPNLKARYGQRLEALYDTLASQQIEELRTLRTQGMHLPIDEAVTRSVAATLGLSQDEIDLTQTFNELGGDSLSALELSGLIEDIFNMDLQVGVITDPSANLQRIVEQIESERRCGIARVSFNTIHGEDASIIQASDFQLARFFDPTAVDMGAKRPVRDQQIKTVLLTGATGYLGRFLMIAWLERLSQQGGTLIVLARGKDVDEVKARLRDTLASDAELMDHFTRLAADHLRVIAGDLSAPSLGLDEVTWARLADEVDLIVHSGAHVNHRLPYKQLFHANVSGTAELIRLALTGAMTPLSYVSTLGVSALSAPDLIDEDSDIRVAIPSAEINEHYANGYNVSKWGSEVLLREAHDNYGLPVTVFRPGMILAHRRYQGQLNVPDMLTRLLYSLAVTGVAPATFYAENLAQGRPAGQYQGFAVDFLADVITDIASGASQRGFHSFNLANFDDAEIGLDQFVDWMIAAGCQIERIDSYSSWFARFETAMNALNETQRSQSMLALLGPYREPQRTQGGAGLKTEQFRTAAADAGYDVPHLCRELIEKYVSDLRYLGLLSR
jgi:fatty acid CoA ligase FadD9